MPGSGSKCRSCLRPQGNGDAQVVAGGNPVGEELQGKRQFERRVGRGKLPILQSQACEGRLCQLPVTSPQFALGQVRGFSARVDGFQVDERIEIRPSSCQLDVSDRVSRQD